MTTIQNTRWSWPVIDYCRINESSGVVILISWPQYHGVSLGRSQTCNSCKTSKEFTGTGDFLLRKMGSFSIRENKSLIHNYHKRLQAVIHVMRGNTQYHQCSVSNKILLDFMSPFILPIKYEPLLWFSKQLYLESSPKSSETALE